MHRKKIGSGKKWSVQWPRGPGRLYALCVIKCAGVMLSVCLSPRPAALANCKSSFWSTERTTSTPQGMTDCSPHLQLFGTGGGESNAIESSILIHYYNARIDKAIHLTTWDCDPISQSDHTNLVPRLWRVNGCVTAQEQGYWSSQYSWQNLADKTKLKRVLCMP